jgi:hypothetical protein
MEDGASKARELRCLKEYAAEIGSDRGHGGSLFASNVTVSQSPVIARLPQRVVSTLSSCYDRAVDQKEPAMPAFDDFDNPEAQRLWHRAEAQWALAGKATGAAQATYEVNAIVLERQAFEQESSVLRGVSRPLRVI